MHLIILDNLIKMNMYIKREAKRQKTSNSKFMMKI